MSEQNHLPVADPRLMRMREIALVLLGLCIPLVGYAVFRLVDVMLLASGPGWRSHVAAGAYLLASLLLAGTCLHVVRRRASPSQWVVGAMVGMIWVAILAS